VGVVVIDELSKDGFELPSVEDQHPVEALVAGTTPSLAEPESPPRSA
jgi:hypothetical protein